MYHYITDRTGAVFYTLSWNKYQVDIQTGMSLTIDWIDLAVFEFLKAWLNFLPLSNSWPKFGSIGILPRKFNSYFFARTSPPPKQRILRWNLLHAGKNRNPPVKPKVGCVFPNDHRVKTLHFINCICYERDSNKRTCIEYVATFVTIWANESRHIFNQSSDVNSSFFAKVNFSCHIL